MTSLCLHARFAGSLANSASDLGHAAGEPVKRRT